MGTPAFSKNVFINCPFDSDYVALLRPLLFTVLYLGYTPRIASEHLDSGEPRIDKIVGLIRQSSLSIHDLSRIEATSKKELYRLNMAFELGVDFGFRLFAGGEARSKRFLILERERYRYQKALSDLSGSDIKNHNDEPEDLVVREVRNWFVEITALRAASGTRIWEDLNEFMADFHQKREEQGYSGKDLETMPTQEYVDFIKEWLEDKGIVKSS